MRGRGGPAVAARGSVGVGRRRRRWVPAAGAWAAVGGLRLRPGSSGGSTWAMAGEGVTAGEPALTSPGRGLLPDPRGPVQLCFSRVKPPEGLEFYPATERACGWPSPRVSSLFGSFLTFSREPRAGRRLPAPDARTGRSGARSRAGLDPAQLRVVRRLRRRRREPFGAAQSAWASRQIACARFSEGCRASAGMPGEGVTAGKLGTPEPGALVAEDQRDRSRRAGPPRLRTPRGRADAPPHHPAAVGDRLLERAGEPRPASTSSAPTASVRARAVVRAPRRADPRPLALPEVLERRGQPRRGSPACAGGRGRSEPAWAWRADAERRRASNGGSAGPCPRTRPAV